MDTMVVIIGAGQAGLAMSRQLVDRGVEHVLLERGTVANSWRTERWDSLRLLTPNWLSRLPGHTYTGSDPEGFMAATEVADMLDHYRASFDAPIHTGVTVTDVRRAAAGFTVDTDQGTWRCQAVVVATGAASTPHVPGIAAHVPGRIHQLTPTHYRNPDQLDDGPVLVVGASASGAQLADELHRSGRDVVLAVGDHVRLPRQYRQMDIHWWMETIGLLDDRIEDQSRPARARRLPSLQLVGSDDGRSVDLNALSDIGIELVGRLADVHGSTALFADGLATTCRSADGRMRRLLARIDDFAAANGLDAEVGAPDAPAPIRIPRSRTTIDMAQFATVLWATGFRPDYPWLDARALDERGAIRHDRGVGAMPGLYVLGLPFMRRRKSSFLDGVGPDAAELSAHLVTRLHRRPSAAGIAAGSATTQERSS
ncbi:MAG TPA: NAD(P)-binding domain-containing protein [Nitriliruptoraceae bacterium]|nr:NAD(P)-binding domain-containing protein [Nitriliruptoraceae bacterium]